tara:strand:+ start:284 stop:439 length:156 start_codon:yes stop_codon:yes gene_type:complete
MDDFFFEGYRHTIEFWNDGMKDRYRIINSMSGRVIKTGDVEIGSKTRQESL